MSLPLEVKVKNDVLVIDSHTGSPWHSLPGPAVRDREALLKKSTITSKLHAADKQKSGSAATESKKSSALIPRQILHLLIKDRKFKAVLLGLVLLYLDRRVKASTLVAFLAGSALFSNKESI